MKKASLMKKGVLLGAMALSVAVLNSNDVNVQAAEIAVTQSIVEMEESIDPVYAGEDLIIPVGTTVIEDNAFYGMNFTGNLVIPEGVTSIGANAFYNCGFTGELVLPESLESIGDYAFYGCMFTGKLVIPENVKSIGANAFYNCSKLDGELMVLGDEVSVEKGAFWGTGILHAYFAGANVSFHDVKGSYPSEYMAFGRTDLTIHAPFQSTARTYAAECNSRWRWSWNFRPWEGRYDIEEMGISADSLPLDIGESKTLTLSIFPEIAANQTIYWESSDEKIATVKDGVVTAVGYGVATIEAYTSMGDSVSCQATVLPFADVNKSSWEYPGICYVYGRGMMTGTTGTEFKPGGKLTRSEFVTVLYSYSGKPAVTYSSRFTDVPEKEWYTSAVLWAAENGVTAGYGDRFGVADNITREQFVTMLYAYGKESGAVTESVSGNLYSYADYGEVDSWAREALVWATQNGLVSGKIKNGKTYLDPLGTATRAECATIMMQYDRNFGKE